MKQFAFAVLFILVSQCSAATVDFDPRVVAPSNTSLQQQQQRRDLSVSNWFWSILNHIGVHPPCVGPAKNQSHCHHSSSSSHSSGGGSSSGGSSSSSSWTSDGYDADGNTENASDGEGDSSSSSSSSSTNDAWAADGYDSSNSGNGNSSSSGGDGSSSSSGNNDASGTDGWESSNLGNGSSSGAGSSMGLKAESIIPFIVGALVAGVIGAAIVVGRKRRQQQDDAHPLEGSLKKRMKLFSGGVFQKKRNGALADDIEAGNDTPAFIEISSVRSGISNGHASRNVEIRTSSYRAPPPQQGPVLSGFDDSDDDESYR